jgi:hypothetical protein
VLGEFLSRCESEDHRLELVMLIYVTAQDAIDCRVGFLGEIPELGV